MSYDRAAALLADAWAPALATAQNLGYEAGYAAGRWDAEQEMARAWRAAALSIQSVLNLPTQAELAVIRGEAA